ncbi:MAG: FGGY-family carbohydrate kinase, partial [Bacteroidota bacterium]
SDAFSSDYLKINSDMLPELVETFSEQSKVSQKGAKESGLLPGTPILYRAGDQPNNALTLNVLHTGEVAATGGTSGVMYAITDNLNVSEYDKVNNFAHVNYDFKGNRKIGKLLCINGAGIQYRWLLNNLKLSSYEEMNHLASEVEVGSDGVCILPFGNGPERIFKNREIGTRILGLNLNRHHKGHLCRAALEGIAFAFVYGFEIMQSDGIAPKAIRAGNDNLFRSEIFSKTLATLIQKEIEIYDTTGAVGAARACIVHSGGYQKFSSFVQNDYSMTYVPESQNDAFKKAYDMWKKELHRTIK